MLRRLWTMVVVFLFMAIFASSVGASPTENKSVSLISATFNSGTGIILLFETSGLNQKDLKNAAVFAHSNEYKMSCSFKDDSSVVRCVIPGGLTQYAGESFSGVLAGFRFWSEIPERKADELSCPEGQTLWYLLAIYEYGEYLGSDYLPAEIYAYILELLASNPEELGDISVQITGQFCDEDFDLELPQ